MQVILTIKDLPTKTLTLAEWIEIGKIKGYCKAHKIYAYQITGIEYVPNQIISDEARN